VGVVDAIAPGVADLIWNRALNQRLGTANLTTLEIYNTAASRNMSFSDVFNIPEQVWPILMWSPSKCVLTYRRALG